MSDLVMLMEPSKDRTVLMEWLREDFGPVRELSNIDLTTDFDLAFLDLPFLERLSERITARRKRVEPLLQPFLLIAEDTEGGVMARHLGKTVDDLIIMPLDRVEVQARVNNLMRLRNLSLELKKQHAKVELLAVTDDVSGYYNTRYLHQYLDELLEDAEVEQGKLSLIFFDLDNFKKVVDTHGHMLGAKVLREVAQEVAKHLDKEDRIIRYGGDEYVVILPGQGKTAALEKTRKIRKGLTHASYLKAEQLDIRVTASLGVATYPKDAANKTELLAEADRCLFTSKARGKNRISVAGRKEA